jgi:hypothetical protein
MDSPKPKQFGLGACPGHITAILGRNWAVKVLAKKFNKSKVQQRVR